SYVEVGQGERYGRILFDREGHVARDLGCNIFWFDHRDSKVERPAVRFPVGYGHRHPQNTAEILVWRDGRAGNDVVASFVHGHAEPVGVGVVEINNDQVVKLNGQWTTALRFQGFL